MIESDIILLASEEIARHLETAPLDEYLLIPGIGGLCTKRYRTYPSGGSNLDQFKPFWSADQELRDVAEGRLKTVLPQQNDYHKIAKRWQKSTKSVTHLPDSNSKIPILAEWMFNEFKQAGRVNVIRVGIFEIIAASTGNMVIKFSGSTELLERISKARNLIVGK
jgi:hypothetical protein